MAVCMYEHNYVCSGSNNQVEHVLGMRLGATMHTFVPTNMSSVTIKDNNACV